DGAGKTGGPVGLPPRARCMNRPVLAQTVNELPQPQPPAALGLLKVNPEPWKVLTKSTSTPPRYCMLNGSTKRRSPLDSSTRSSSAASSSMFRPYWNPEQPPGKIGRAHV